MYLVHDDIETLAAFGVTRGDVARVVALPADTNFLVSPAVLTQWVMTAVTGGRGDDIPGLRHAGT